MWHEGCKGITCTYHCYKVAHVAGNGGINLLICRWLNDDGDILRLG